MKWIAFIVMTLFLPSCFSHAQKKEEVKEVIKEKTVCPSSSQKEEEARENLIILFVRLLGPAVEFDDRASIKQTLDSLRGLADVRDYAVWTVLEDSVITSESRQTKLTFPPLDSIQKEELCSNPNVKPMRIKKMDSTIYQMPICLKSATVKSEALGALAAVEIAD